MKRHPRKPLGAQMYKILALLLVFPLASCGDGGTEPEVLEAVADYFTGVSVPGSTASAQLMTGAPPSAGSGPTVSAPTTGAVVTGGSSQVPLTASSAFQTVVVFVDGVDGYFQVDLPVAVTSVTLVVTLSGAADIPELTFDCIYSVAAAGGEFGPRSRTTVTATPGAGGDIQVNVSWNTVADVDLHVVEPSGEEIYYLNRTSATGGELDIDANAACSTDDIFAENVGWPTNSAPRGQYVVRVDYWSSCGVTQTDYVVTVTRGSIVQTFTGSFTGEGTNGGLGDGTEITSFTF